MNDRFECMYIKLKDFIEEYKLEHIHNEDTLEVVAKNIFGAQGWFLESKEKKSMLDITYRFVRKSNE